MSFRVVDAQLVHDRVLWLFSDGAEGEIDLGAELDGSIFEPLKKHRLLQAISYRS